MIDVAFFALVYILRIPRLNFGVWIISLFCLSLILVNVGIVGWLRADPESSSIGGVFGGGNQLHVKAAARKKAATDSDNIRGSKLVTIVPPTLLKMNPNGTLAGDKYCIGGTTESVFLPIRVKGVPPFEMIYERIDFSGNIIERTATFGSPELETNDEAQGEKKKKRVVLNHLFEFTEPGVYRATSVREIGGDGASNGRILPTLTLITACPDTRLVFKDNVDSVDRCIGSDAKLDIVAVGSPPFTATYSRRIGREASSDFTIDMSRDTIDYTSINTGAR